MAHIYMERSGEMEVFARVVREGGFSAAARTLDLTPSAVSKLIARLEDRLGSRLLVRTTRAVSLTPEGEAYYQGAIRVLQDLNDTDLLASGNALRGRLNVNASIPFGTMFLLPLIPKFLKHHPDVVLDVSLTDEVVDLVGERADVAIRMGSLPDSSLKAKRLGQSRRVVCASPDYLKRNRMPGVPADLRSHECLAFNFRRSRGGWPFRDGRRHFEQAVGGHIQVNNGETMRQLALVGAGIARLGYFHVAADIKAGNLVPVLEKFNPGDLEPVHAVYVGGGNAPQRVRIFIDFIAKALAANPLWTKN